jgi:hypothetical protein
MKQEKNRVGNCPVENKDIESEVPLDIKVEPDSKYVDNYNTMLEALGEIKKEINRAYPVENTGVGMENFNMSTAWFTLGIIACTTFTALRKVEE